MTFYLCDVKPSTNALLSVIHQGTTFNTFRLRYNAHCFADNIFECIIIQHCFKLPSLFGTKPLPEPMTTRSTDPYMYYLRDWSQSGGSYGNNTQVICCPAPGRPESAARGTSPPDNKSQGCCGNSRPTVINPDYNMTKQRCMKRIYDKIRPKSPPNGATSPTCLHCDVTHLSLTTGVVALHIPSWRIEVREERRQARKIVWPVNAGRVICRHQNDLVESSITINI